MKICNKCLGEQKDENIFCENCGQRLDYLVIEENMFDGTQVKDYAKNNKNGTSKIKFFAIILAIVLVASYVALHIIFTPEKTVDKFINAMNNKDFSMLSSVAVVSVNKMALIKENVEPMFDLYSNSKKFKSRVIGALDDDIENIKNGDSPEHGDVVNLVVHNYIFFKTYKVMISACTVKVNSNLDNTIFTIGANTATVSDSKKSATIENILPGNYIMKSVCNSEIGTEFSEEEEYDIYDGINERISTDFVCSTLKIEESENTDITSITVNNKPVKFEERGKGIIYLTALKKDCVVTVNHENSWGGELSDSYTMVTSDSDEFFYPNFEADNKTKVVVATAAVNAVIDAYEAFNDRDIEKLSGMADCFTIKDFINSIKDYNDEDERQLDFRFYVKYGMKDGYGSKDIVDFDDTDDYQTCVYINYDYIYTTNKKSVITNHVDALSSSYLVTMSYQDGEWICTDIEYKEYSYNDYVDSVYVN